jgi:hypothetical protein
MLRIIEQLRIRSIAVRDHVGELRRSRRLARGATEIKQRDIPQGIVETVAEGVEADLDEHRQAETQRTPDFEWAEETPVVDVVVEIIELEDRWVDDRFLVVAVIKRFDVVLEWDRIFGLGWGVGVWNP